MASDSLAAIITLTITIMAPKREELLQSLLEKMGNVLKSIHSKHCFLIGDFQLSRPQVMILFFIAKHEKGVSSKELAAFLNVTSGAITQFIDILVEKNLVKREEDTVDRRILNITLTADAQKHLVALKKNYNHSIAPLFDELNEEEIQQFILLLDKIKTREQ